MKLTINEKIGFGAGDMAIAIVMMSLAMIITFFYTDIFGLKPIDLGVLLFSVRILDAVIDPVVGTMTDRTTTRWENIDHGCFLCQYRLGLAFG